MSRATFEACLRGFRHLDKTIQRTIDTWSVLESNDERNLRIDAYVCLVGGMVSHYMRNRANPDFQDLINEFLTIRESVLPKLREFDTLAKSSVNRTLANITI